MKHCSSPAGISEVKTGHLGWQSRNALACADTQQLAPGTQFTEMSQEWLLRETQGPCPPTQLAANKYMFPKQPTLSLDSSTLHYGAVEEVVRGEVSKKDSRDKNMSLGARSHQACPLISKVSMHFALYTYWPHDYLLLWVDGQTTTATFPVSSPFHGLKGHLTAQALMSPCVAPSAIPDLISLHVKSSCSNRRKAQFCTALIQTLPHPTTAW